MKVRTEIEYLQQIHAILTDQSTLLKAELMQKSLRQGYLRKRINDVSKKIGELKRVITISEIKKVYPEFYVVKLGDNFYEAREKSETPFYFSQSKNSEKDAINKFYNKWVLEEKKRIGENSET